MTEHNTSRILSKVCEQVATVRVSVARLEVQADETRRWIDAHRQRTTGLESAANTRFEDLGRRASETEARATELGHHLKYTISQVAENRERLKALEVASSGIRKLEVAGPLTLLAAVIVAKLMGIDASSLIGK